jgi:ApaG protein
MSSPVPAGPVRARAGLYSFAYTITITNTGEVPAQLISRHWIIERRAGHTEEVKGLGVVGHQPLLQTRRIVPVHQRLPAAHPTGTMRGSYFCVAEDGEPL